MGIKLESYRASRLNYVNKVEGASQKLQVKQKFNTRVNYLSDNKCACIYGVEIVDADESLPFSISAELVGIFSYDEDMSKVDIHVETTRQLFPYLKSAVSMLTTLACAPVFNIQFHEVRPEDVVGHTEEPVKGIN